MQSHNPKPPEPHQGQTETVGQALHATRVTDAFTQCPPSPQPPTNSTVDAAVALGAQLGRDVRPWGGDTVLLDGRTPISAHHALSRLRGQQ